jgi:2-polyprenyl-3-methyl-5-hydroxy-6-metoxy-1,4-benzoquinol methylase
MQKPTEIFGKWAEEGKDVGMEKGHATSVKDMLDFALQERTNIGKNFSFLDLGCGNGWVARKISKNSLCAKAVGIDGAEQMINNAKKIGGQVNYILADINSYISPMKFDLIHSMEVLYYLDDPASKVKSLCDHWLEEQGRLIIGIDHYYENLDSHSWEEKVGTPMLMLKEAEWLDIFHESGLSDIKSWRSNQSKDWSGTLVLTGKKR